MNHIKSHIILFSSFNAGLNPILNSIHYDTVIGRLKSDGITFQEMVGVYKGVKEPSFLVLAKYENVVRELCHFTKQDCYLYSNNERMSTLIYLDGKTEEIGILKRVNESVAMELDAYTHDPVRNTYWATLK